MKLSHKLLLLACAASLVITQAAAAAEEDIWGDIEDDEAGGKKSDGKMTGNGKPKKDGEEEDNSPLSFFERHGMVFMYLAVMFVNKFIRGWLQKREAAAAEPGGLVKAIHSDAEWKEALEEWKKTNQLARSAMTCPIYVLVSCCGGRENKGEREPRKPCYWCSRR